MTNPITFQPNWASPPGHTIEDALEEAGMTAVEFAQRIELSAEHISALIGGKLPITPDIALKLEGVLGSSAAFWLRREAQYQEDQARLAL